MPESLALRMEPFLAWKIVKVVVYGESPTRKVWATGLLLNFVGCGEIRGDA